MSYNPKINILEKLKKQARDAYIYPIHKQNLGIIRICPNALRKMATNLIRRGFDKDELVEVDGMIMDLSEEEKDVFCYYS